MPLEEDSVPMNEKCVVDVSGSEVIVTGCGARRRRLWDLGGELHQALHAVGEVDSLFCCERTPNRSLAFKYNIPECATVTIPCEPLCSLQYIVLVAMHKLGVQ